MYQANYGAHPLATSTAAQPSLPLSTNEEAGGGSGNNDKEVWGAVLPSTPGFVQYRSAGIVSKSNYTGSEFASATCCIWHGLTVKYLLYATDDW